MTASAVGMDKVAMRRVFVAEGLPFVPGAWFTRQHGPVREAGGWART